MSVDEPAIRVRKGRRYAQSRVGTDLWVQVPGLDRSTAAAVVAAALPLTGEGFGHVLPTSGGTYLWRADVNEAKHLPARLVEALRAQGHEATVGVAPVDPCPQTLTDVAFPGAVMAYRMASPVDAMDRYEDGRLKATWGVHRGPTDRLLAQATRWVVDGSAPATVGRISSVPLTPDDAVDVVGRELGRNPLRLLLARWREDLTGMRRLVRFDAFGRVAWTDLDPGAPWLALAEAATERLVEAATELDYGCVRPVFPAATEFTDTPAGYWRHHRETWATHVPDAYGIQLLTVDQLGRAADLSGWTVQPVAPDRFLVTARELEAWFSPQGPSDDVRRRARADFGAMVLSGTAPSAAPRGRTYPADYAGQHCHAELFCPGEDTAHHAYPDDDDEGPAPEPVFDRWVTSQERETRSITIDWVGAHTRFDAHFGRHVDLRVALDGLERQASAQAVRDAVRSVLGDDGADVRPTSGGTWLDLQSPGWADDLGRLVQHWEAAGLSGSVVPSEVYPWSPEGRRPDVVSAVMVWPPEVPHAQWERNATGWAVRPQWGVSAPVTDRLLAEAGDWIVRGVARLRSGKVPVTAEDFSDVVGAALAEEAAIEVRGGERYVSFDNFGACAWGEHAPQDPVLAQVAAATSRLVESAPDLSYGCVAVGQAGGSAFHGTLDTSAVRRSPHLLASYVPEVQGVQLVTGAHLARAHDLDDWRVESVAPDRFLVTARDLAAWFPVAESGPGRAPRELQEKAREDFGDMVMTFALAKANPVFPV